ncbi:MAG: MFS transporter, partial [Acidimicrobiaceae bacterium]|nr:MFS transporter [Acidimicrobiaceae bacterium]
YLRGGRGTTLSFAAFAVVWPTIGWAVGSWMSSRLQERGMKARIVIVIGSVLLTSAAIAVAVAAAARTSFTVLFAAFICLGLGIGTITSASLAMLQSQAAPAEMGRVSSAQQFIRSLGWTYGAAVAGAVLFWGVERRAGDVEAVRGLLDDSEAVLDTTLADTLSSAYAWSLGALAVVSALTVPAALVLFRRYNPDRTTRD